MQTFRLKWVALASLVMLAGCGSSSGGASVKITDYANNSAIAACHRYFTCCDATELADNPAWGASEADCVTMMTATASDAVTMLQAGIDAGKITYHGDRAAKCIENVTALSCANWGVNFNTRYVPDCAHVFDGTLAIAAACTRDEECMSGFCSASACAARGALGDACTAPTACQDGLYCPVSAGDHCVAIAKVGATCEISIACENNSCVIPDGATSGTCGTPMMCNGV
jgi:hypothetical protein